MITFILFSRAIFFITYEGIILKPTIGRSKQADNSRVSFFIRASLLITYQQAKLVSWKHFSLSLPIYLSLPLSLPLYPYLSLSLSPLSLYFPISLHLSLYFRLYFSISLLFCVTLAALPSPVPFPPLSLSTHAMLPVPSPLRCFHWCRRICNPWLPLSPPPSFAISVSVVVTPPPLLLQHLQPR